MVVLPSRLKRHVGRLVYGWDIHPTAYLGRSIVLVKKLTMEAGSSIGPFNVIRDLEELRLGEGASIATRNHIVGFPLWMDVFPYSPNRNPSLIMGKGSMITVAHDIDCSDRVEIGDHSGLVGFHTSVLTHSMNPVRDRFTCAPVVIGHHTGIMSDCVLMNGARIPSRCIISAGSVVNTPLKKELTFYCGNPAEAVRELPDTLKFFHRGEGTDEDSGLLELRQ
jgi:acetyltransferase-like isoleucine patch superfamily enzyme